MEVKQLIQEMQEVFLEGTRRLERSSGFCQRTSPITATAWVQGLVFAWLSEPQASVRSLACALAEAGAAVSPQAVQQRFTAAGARLLAQVLEQLALYALKHGMCNSIHPDPETAQRQLLWLRAFPRIWIRDSTIVSLPLALRAVWKGMGGFAGPSAGMKISVQWEWHSGTLLPFHLSPACVHDETVAQQQDQATFEQGHRVTQGEMHLFDLGYFRLAWLAQLAAQGAYFCCRYKCGTHVIRLVAGGKHSTATLVDWLAQVPADQDRLEWEVALGKEKRVGCRLLALRLPEEVKIELQQRLSARCERKRQNLSQDRLELCGWTVLVTNAPPEKLSFEQAFVLYRLRWQIERLFRLWKESLKIDEWRTQNPYRIECEIYAKLIGALLTQQITAYAAWNDPARSLVQCAHLVARHAMALLANLGCQRALTHLIQSIRSACGPATRLNTRRKKPSTCQRLKAVQGALA